MIIPPSHARTCKGCGADVAMVRCPGKKRGENAWAAVDFLASHDGTVFVQEQSVDNRKPMLIGGIIEKRGVRDGMRAAGTTLHTVHDKTCPKADLFKRLRKPLY